MHLVVYLQYQKHCLFRTHVLLKVSKILLNILLPLGDKVMSGCWRKAAQYIFRGLILKSNLLVFVGQLLSETSRSPFGSTDITHSLLFHIGTFMGILPMSHNTWS